MRGVGSLIDTAVRAKNAERKDKESQIQKLEQLITEVGSLIDAGQLDRAEIKASEIQWQPDPTRSMISQTDAKLIKQYDERRETLKRVIARKLAAK